MTHPSIPARWQSAGFGGRLRDLPFPITLISPPTSPPTPFSPSSSTHLSAPPPPSTHLSTSTYSSFPPPSTPLPPPPRPIHPPLSHILHLLHQFTPLSFPHPPLSPPPPPIHLHRYYILQRGRGGGRRGRRCATIKKKKLFPPKIARI